MTCKSDLSWGERVSWRSGFLLARGCALCGLIIKKDMTPVLEVIHQEFGNSIQASEGSHTLITTASPNYAS